MSRVLAKMDKLGKTMNRSLVLKRCGGAYNCRSDFRSLKISSGRASPRSFPDKYLQAK
jgi:hypothetical protein